MPNQMKTTKKVNKMREAIIQSFLACLKEDEIPWHREWSVKGKPFNAITKTGYNGVNAFWLSFIQQAKGYNDPRWCTFRQANEKGWKIRSGEKGTKIEFWSLYDREKKEKVTSAEAEKRGEHLSQKQYLERFRPVSNTYTVFNGEQIEGIEPYIPTTYKLSEAQLLSARNTLITNMDVGFEEGGDQAFYSPGQDKVVLPEIKKFESEYGYMSTLLHECAHASGAPNRLNREMNDAFGTPGYAREELRAEIASAFTAQTTGIQYKQNEFMENHKAYVQSWINTLENHPNELFAAIKDAEKISDYLIEKGEFLKEREAVYELTMKDSENVVAYSHVKETDSGYEYALYNANGVEMDHGKGITDTPHMSLEDVATDSLGVEGITSRKVNLQEFMQNAQTLADLNNSWEAINKLNPETIENIAMQWANEKLEWMGYDDINITRVKMYGSASKGTQNIHSDIDILLQYEGNIAEDTLFNLLNKDGLKIFNIPVDINPITSEKSGTIEEYLQRNGEYQNTGKEIAKTPKEIYKEYMEIHQAKLQEMSTGKEVLVINAFAGPGAGKSVSCMDICSELKKRGYNAEYVQEYAKELVYEHNMEMLDGSEAHQFAILKEQVHRMDRLYQDVDFIVTDSPVLLNAIYNSNPTPEYNEMIDTIFSHYNNFSYFVERDTSHFQEEGRIHNLQQSLEKDNEVKNMLKDHDVYFGTYPHNRIMKVVDNSIVTFNRLNQEAPTIDVLNKKGIDITRYKFEDKYVEFKAKVHDKEYTGLFRIHDPEQGADMKLVMFVHQDGEPKLTENWNDIERHMQEITTKKHEQILQEENNKYIQIGSDMAQNLFREDISIYHKDNNVFKEVTDIEDNKEQLYAKKEDIKSFQKYQGQLQMVREMEDELDLPEAMRVTTKDGCVSKELLQMKYQQLVSEKQMNLNKGLAPNQIRQYMKENTKGVSKSPHRTKAPAMEM